MRLIGEALCLAAAVRPLYISDRVGTGFGGAGQLQSMTWLRKSAVFN